MDLYHERANLLRVLAHPVRLRILDELRSDAECVCHLSALLNKPQPYVSQQLAVLRNEGLIVDRREGANVFYELTSGETGAQAAAVMEALVNREPVRGARGHRRIPGCYCPKCEPEGTCSAPLGVAAGRR